MKKCNKCGKEFENGKSYGGHISQCGKNKICELCGKSFTIVNFNKHIKTHDKKINCLNCGKIVEGSIVSNKTKFCSHSCSAIYNNKGVRRHGENPKNCLTCGEKLSSSNKTYCNHKCRREKDWLKAKEKIELTGLFGNCDCTARRFAKKYLIEKYGHKCSICGQTEWTGQPIPLITDHIDGNHNNNKVENFRMVCGNCDMLLPTFAGKNRGNGRVWRKNYYKTGNASRLINKNADIAQLVE